MEEGGGDDQGLPPTGASPSDDSRRTSDEDVSLNVHWDDEESGEKEVVEETHTPPEHDSLLTVRVFSLLLIGLNEAVVVALLWPFLPDLVARFGLGRDGLYVGLLGSSFFLAQLLTAYFWGKSADRWGRRPVLVIGVLGSAIGMLALGFSRSYAWAVFARLLTGGLNGCVGVSKTMLAEIVGPKTKSTAFGLMAFTWGSGAIIGPLIGGFLADPAQRFHWTDQKTNPITSFLTYYPYFLPSACGVLVSLTAFVFAFLGLTESPTFQPSTSPILPCFTSSTTHTYSRLPTKQHNENDTDDDRECADGEDGRVVVGDGGDVELTELKRDASEEGGDKLATTPSTSPLSRTEVRAALALYGVAALGTVIVDELFPVIAELPRSRGGFGLTPSQVGLCLTTQGATLLVFQLAFFPRLCDWLGPLFLFKGSAALLLPLALILPIFATVSEWTMLPWVALQVWCGCKSILVADLFSTVFILIPHASQNQDLGTVNGVGQTVAATVRTVGPAIGGAAFALSLQAKSTLPPFATGGVIFALGAFVAHRFLPPWVDSGEKGESRSENNA